ncbi:hypothetical protein GCM10010912_39480 [Paenibacillus albidus]|uniref:Glycosyltransferase RgtA/B/C/D-like domain-containing protein n=1 Tax=Paenibacillus albidus TaxID=2041023 RepID=A0A917FMU5_9BACL|nr:hypothetical protein [Paenibacillus albidus]GGF90438.1 hypothetical protein GCM10010912_39480 [Paenibacillus albidus]
MNKHDKLLSFIYMGVMLAAALYWAISADSWTVPGTVAAVACWVLFTGLGLRAIPPFTSYLVSPGDPQKVAPTGPENGRQQTWIRIVAWVLASRILLLLLAYAFLIINNGYTGGLFETLTETWHLQGIDAASYLGIAERGYVTEGDARFHLVFLPFFPLVMKMVQVFVGDYLVAGFIVSNVCAVAAALFAYELARLDLRREEALRVVKYIFVFPSAFFFFIPMTESLFLLLSLMCLYYVRRKNWLLGCLCGALAGFTRSPGILLAVPVAVEMARDLITSYRLLDKKAFVRRFAAAFICLATISLGLLAYLYVNYLVSGNAFQFSIYQREHWFQRLYLFFDTVRYQTEYAVRTFREGDTRSLLGLWLPNLVCIFAVLILMFQSAKKLHPSYTLYFIVYFAYVVGPTWLLSAPRYFAVAFPLAFAAVLLTPDKRKDVVLTSLAILGSVVYLAVFVAGYPVY